MLTHFFSFSSIFCGQNCLIHTRWKFTPPESEVSHKLSRESVRSVQRFSRNWQHTILFSQFSHRSHRRCSSPFGKCYSLIWTEGISEASVSERNHFWRAWYEKRSLMLRERKGKSFRERRVHLLNGAFELVGCWQQSLKRVPRRFCAFRRNLLL